jgi:hypothetical protein
MSNRPTRQHGGSAIMLLIVLAIIGFGVFIALQYVPQYMEAGSVDSMLSNIEQQHRQEPFQNTHEIKERIDKLLYINEVEHLRDVIEVVQDVDEYTITVDYERELNLLYTKKPMPYTKTLVLR